MAHIDHHARPLLAALAAEIRDVRTLVEGLADIIVADEALVHRYLTELQAFDLVIQRSDANADVLDRIADGARARDAIRDVRLECVATRLSAALDRRHHG